MKTVSTPSDRPLGFLDSDERVPHDLRFGTHFPEKNQDCGELPSLVTAASYSQAAKTSAVAFEPQGRHARRVQPHHRHLE